MPAGVLLKKDATDRGGMGCSDGCAGCVRSDLHGRVAVSYDRAIAVCVVAGHAFLDRGTGVACSAAAVSDSEYRSDGVAGEAELQPLSVAAVVCVWGASEAVVFPTAGGGGGERVVLPGGAADDPDEGTQRGAAEGGEDVGGSGVGSQLRVVQLPWTDCGSWKFTPRSSF